MISLRHFMREQVKQLSPKYGEGEARSMLLILMEEYLACSRSELLFQDKDTLLSTEVLARLSEAIQRLLKGEPLQYILGYTYFFDQQICVAPGVLIPRPETEELVYLIKQDVQHLPEQSFRILDIGTGSACIPIGLASQIGAKHIKQIDAIDFSPEALSVAQVNISQAQIKHSDIAFRLLEQDVFAIQADDSQLGHYDIIISNPPYIHPEEAQEMSASVLDWEPSSALFTPEDNPILYYEQIARLACNKSFLNDGGRIYLELNPVYAEATKQAMYNILASERCIAKAELLADMSAKVRFLSIVLK